MHYFRQTWLIAALGLACGGKDEGTATDGSETGAERGVDERCQRG